MAILSYGIFTFLIIIFLIGSSMDDIYAEVTEITKLTASDGDYGDNFGYTVAISGDTIVVGTSSHYDEEGYGAAYVFTKNGETWSEQAKLIAPNMDSHLVGRLVAISGDTILLSSFEHIEPGVTSSAVYVFTRSGTTWNVEAKLTSPGALDDKFGSNLAISGDTIVIGAYSDDELARNSGAAYVFTRSETTWSVQAKLTASDAEEFDSLSTGDVSISGDTILLGAALEDTKGDRAGAAYVYEKPSSGWVDATETVKLTAFDGLEGDRFGLSGDISDDRIVIGSMRSYVDGYQTGSAYVFEKNTADNWIGTAKITGSDLTEYAAFGNPAVFGDIIAIGAAYDSDPAEWAGSAFVFIPSTYAWSEHEKFTASDIELWDVYGADVDMWENTLVIGSIGDDDLGDESGAVYVYNLEFEYQPGPFTKCIQELEKNMFTLAESRYSFMHSLITSDDEEIQTVIEANLDGIQVITPVLILYVECEKAKLNYESPTVEVFELPICLRPIENFPNLQCTNGETCPIDGCPYPFYRADIDPKVYKLFSSFALEEIGRNQLEFDAAKLISQDMLVVQFEQGK